MKLFLLRLKQNKGETLVEIIVSFLILSVLLGLVVYSINFSSGEIRKSVVSAREFQSNEVNGAILNTVDDEQIKIDFKFVGPIEFSVNINTAEFDEEPCGEPAAICPQCAGTPNIACTKKVLVFSCGECVFCNAFNNPAECHNGLIAFFPEV